MLAFAIYDPVVTPELRRDYPPDGHKVPDGRLGYTPDELNQWYDAIGVDGCRVYVRGANFDFYAIMPLYPLLLGSSLVALLLRQQVSNNKSTFVVYLPLAAVAADIIETFLQRKGCVIYPLRLSDTMLSIAGNANRLKWAGNCGQPTLDIWSFCQEQADIIVVKQEGLTLYSHHSATSPLLLLILYSIIMMRLAFSISRPAPVVTKARSTSVDSDSSSSYKWCGLTSISDGTDELLLSRCCCCCCCWASCAAASRNLTMGCSKSFYQRVRCLHVVVVVITSDIMVVLGGFVIRFAPPLWISLIPTSVGGERRRADRRRWFVASLVVVRHKRQVTDLLAQREGVQSSHAGVQSDRTKSSLPKLHRRTKSRRAPTTPCVGWINPQIVILIQQVVHFLLTLMHAYLFIFDGRDFSFVERQASWPVQLAQL